MLPLNSSFVPGRLETSYRALEIAEINYRG